MGSDSDERKSGSGCSTSSHCAGAGDVVGCVITFNLTDAPLVQLASISHKIGQLYSFFPSLPSHFVSLTSASLLIEELN